MRNWRKIFSWKNVDIKVLWVHDQDARRKFADGESVILFAWNSPLEVGVGLGEFTTKLSPHGNYVSGMYKDIVRIDYMSLTKAIDLTNTWLNDGVSVILTNKVEETKDVLDIDYMETNI